MTDDAQKFQKMEQERKEEFSFLKLGLPSVYTCQSAQKQR